MAIPFLQVARVGAYIARKHLSGQKRYPLALMLEPLFRCNLACSQRVECVAHCANQQMQQKVQNTSCKTTAAKQQLQINSCNNCRGISFKTYVNACIKFGMRSNQP